MLSFKIQFSPVDSKDDHTQSLSKKAAIFALCYGINLYTTLSNGK
jgi:hypothetical protein